MNDFSNRSFHAKEPMPNPNPLHEDSAGSASKKGLMIAIIVLAAIIIIAAIAYNVLASSTSPKAAEDSDIAVYDFTMQSRDGADVNLSDFAGKPVILNFWASTCGPCRNEMPEFQKAYEQYGNELSFVMVNIPDFNGETREKALSFLEKNGYTFPVYFDAHHEGEAMYGVNSIPRTYFIDKDGNVVLYAPGGIDGTTLLKGIEDLLK